MRQYIELKDPDARREIADAFKVTTAYVSMSLKFKRTGNVPGRICEMALKKGGRLLEVREADTSRCDVVKILNSKGDVIKTINR